MEKPFIAFAGGQASGKSSAARYTAWTRGLDFFSYGDHNRQLAREQFGIAHPRPHHTDAIYRQQMETGGAEAIAAIAGNAYDDSEHGLVVDNLSSLPVAQKLIDDYGIHIISLIAGKGFRYNNSLTRPDTLKRFPTFAAFIESEEAVRGDDLGSRQVLDVVALGHRIVAARPLDEVREELDKHLDDLGVARL